MRVVSLFSGAGGLDLGLKLSGHDIVWANDFDFDSVATYRRNIGDHIVHADIKDVAAMEIPDADVVVGGFPCQGFSQANLQRNIDDPRNELFKEFCRVLGEKKPKYFLAENVRGILSLDGGRAVKAISDAFASTGYAVEFKLMNAADFGVPQARRRVIFIGTRLDLAKKPENVLRHPVATHCSPDKLKDGLKPWVSVGEALSTVADPDAHPHAHPNQVYSQYRVAVRNFTGHRVTDPTKPSPTILARGNGGGGVCALPHPFGHRRMSVRESATVQTFPLDFEFLGRMGSAYRQVGNAVPVRLAEAFGLEMNKVSSALLVGMS